MGNLSATPEDDAAIAAMGVNGIGPNELPDASGTDGLVMSIPHGLGLGVDKLMGFLDTAFDSGASLPGIAPAQPQPDANAPLALNVNPKGASALPAQQMPGSFSYSDQHQAELTANEQYMLDPMENSPLARTVTQTTAGLVEAAPGMAAGPWGAAVLLGGSEGNATYHELRAQGVDDKTAKEEAAVSAITSGAGAFLPLKYGKTLLSSMLGGGAANVAFGGAARYAQGEVLDANGYHEMAEQYRVLDVQAMAADAILGHAFGLMGHATRADEAVHLPPSQVDAAAAVDVENQFARAGIGIPTDPETANLHADTLAAHVDALANDKPLPDISPDVAQKLVDGVLPDPARAEVAQAAHAATMDDPITRAVIDAPDLPNVAHVAEAPEVGNVTEIPKVGALAPEAGSANESHAIPEQPARTASASGGAVHDEMLANLERTHGDTEIQMEDGSTKTVSQVAGEMRQNMADADTRARLHEVAAACFLSTGGAL